MKLRINPCLGTLVVMAMTHAAHAASGTWDGSQNTGTWSDVLNWSALPGTGDTATFDNAGGTNETIDLGPGVTIKDILFDTSAAAYTIGSGTVNSQTLTLNNGGTITASSAIANNQIFNAKLVLGTDATAQTYSITNNDLASTLTLAGGISGGYGGVAGAKTLNVSTANQTGVITLTGAITNGGAGSLALNFSAVSGDVGMTMGNTGNTYSGGTTIGSGVRLQVNAGAGKGLGTRAVTVANNAQAYLNSAGNYANNFSISGNGGSAGGLCFNGIRSAAIRNQNGKLLISPPLPNRSFEGLAECLVASKLTGGSQTAPAPHLPRPPLHDRSFPGHLLDHPVTDDLRSSGGIRKSRGCRGRIHARLRDPRGFPRLQL